MKRNRFLAFFADTRGASAVEFALVAGPFILILLGSVEFGRYVWTRQAVQDTAIAGARCVGVLQRPCEDEGVFNPTRARNFVIATAAGRLYALVPGGTQRFPVSLASLVGREASVFALPADNVRAHPYLISERLALPTIKALMRGGINILISPKGLHLLLALPLNWCRQSCKLIVVSWKKR
jgi:hypothetical protein